MSILSALAAAALLGVSLSLHLRGHGNGAVLQPIASRSQGHRICAELCSSGLGGESCGDACMDIAPQDLPVQSANNGTRRHSDESRRDACPVLCSNSLGRPLCDCDDDARTDRAFDDLDFVQICGTFCVKYAYRIHGCQPCDVYAKSEHVFGVLGAPRRAGLRIDWNEWCKQRCIEGDGGVACNCDILPISIDL